MIILVVSSLFKQKELNSQNLYRLFEFSEIKLSQTVISSRLNALKKKRNPSTTSHKKQCHMLVLRNYFDLKETMGDFNWN